MFEVFADAPYLALVQRDKEPEPSQRRRQQRKKRNDRSSKTTNMDAGWEKHESKSKPGLFYYFNEDTGETRWTPPPDTKKDNTPNTPPMTSPKKTRKKRDNGRGETGGTGDQGEQKDPHHHRFHSKKIRQKRSSSELDPQLQQVQKSSRNTIVIPEMKEQQHDAPKIVKFTAKMAVRLISGKNLSDSKAHYTCELSLWQLRLGKHIKLAEEQVTSAVADGLVPTWEQSFTFGHQVDLSTCDMLKIRVYKGKMFGRKDKGEVMLPLIKYSKLDTNTKEERWHTLQKINKMKSIRGQMNIEIEWRPAGEFVTGQVSNVQHHGFSALNIDHLPKELKKLFKRAGIKKKDLKKNPKLVHQILATYTVEYGSHKEAHKELHKEDSIVAHEEPTVAAGCRAAKGRLLFDYDAMDDTEVSGRKHDIVILLGREEGFYVCANKDGQEGHVQDDFICELTAMPHG